MFFRMFSSWWSSPDMQLWKLFKRITMARAHLLSFWRWSSLCLKRQLNEGYKPAVHSIEALLKSYTSPPRPSSCILEGTADHLKGFYHLLDYYASLLTLENQSSLPLQGQLHAIVESLSAHSQWCLTVNKCKSSCFPLREALVLSSNCNVWFHMQWSEVAS